MGMSILTSNMLHDLDKICYFCIKLEEFTVIESLNQNIIMMYNLCKWHKNKDFFFKILSCFT